MTDVNLWIRSPAPTRARVPAPTPPPAPVQPATVTAVASRRERREPGPRPPTARRHALLGAGVFTLALAVILPTYVYPRVTALPADPQAGQTLEASGVTVLIPDPSANTRFRIMHDADVQITSFVSRADGAAGDSVVWDVATRTFVDGHGLLDARVERVSLDPHSREPTNCCGDRLVTSPADPDGEPLRHRGLFAFPAGLEKQSYPIWDVELRRDRTAAFLGEEERSGLRTYVFQALTPSASLGTTALPGGLFGSDEPAVDAEIKYTDVRTYWVEPATGTVVSLRDEVTREFAYGGRSVTAFSGTLESPPLSGDAVARTGREATILPWLRGRASLVLLGVGLALLAWGRVGARRRRRTTVPARRTAVPARTRRVAPSRRIDPPAESLFTESRSG